MNILSLDPGIAKTGVAIFKDDDLIFWDQLSEAKNAPKQLTKRVNFRIEQLVPYFNNLFHKYHIDGVALEIVPSFARFKNKDLVFATSCALKTLAVQQDILIAEFTPTEWQGLFIGKPPVTKSDIKAKVLSLFPQIPPKTKQDALDSVAIGYIATKCEWDI